MSSPAPANKERDASVREILYFSIGHVPAALAANFYNALNALMIIALGMNPILLGLILAIKTMWDAITDPVMAYITDNAHTPWGRRRPFILFGSTAQVLLLIAIFAFFPRDESIRTNASLVKVESREQAAPAVTAAPAKAPSKPRGPIESITQGVKAFMAADNDYHQRVALYLLGACLLFTLMTTISSVPYSAFGIELSSSYDGRTQVYVYRSAFDKVLGMVGPWILPFCFLPMFTTVVDGMMWFGIITAIIGIPCVVFMFLKTKEHYAAPPKSQPRPRILKSIWLTAKNVHFLKIIGLFIFLALTNGVFTQIGLLLTIYWVYDGDALAGATLGGYAGTLATLLAFLSLPLINYGCRKLGKDGALRLAILWMCIGSALKWVLITPTYPYLQLILPFFFSVGISSVFTILPTMIADVTDVDELNNGTRREGMFGAVAAFLMKTIFTVQPVLAGIVLVMSGFDAGQGVHQSAETIFKMRLMFSLIPAGLLTLGLVVLWRYPLTRKKMEEIKAQLVIQRAAQEELRRASAPSGPYSGI